LLQSAPPGSEPGQKLEPEMTKRSRPRLEQRRVPLWARVNAGGRCRWRFDRIPVSLSGSHHTSAAVERETGVRRKWSRVLLIKRLPHRQELCRVSRPPPDTASVDPSGRHFRSVQSGIGSSSRGPAAIAAAISAATGTSVAPPSRGVSQAPPAAPAPKAKHSTNMVPAWGHSSAEPVNALASALTPARRFPVVMPVLKDQEPMCDRLVMCTPAMKPTHLGHAAPQG